MGGHCLVNQGDDCKLDKLPQWKLTEDCVDMIISLSVYD